MHGAHVHIICTLIHFVGRPNTRMRQIPPLMSGRFRRTRRGVVDTLGTRDNLVGQALCLQERMQGLACSQAGTVLVDPEASLLQRQLAGLLVGSGKTVTD